VGWLVQYCLWLKLWLLPDLGNRSFNARNRFVSLIGQLGWHLEPFSYLVSDLFSGFASDFSTTSRGFCSCCGPIASSLESIIMNCFGKTSPSLKPKRQKGSFSARSRDSRRMLFSATPEWGPKLSWPRAWQWARVSSLSYSLACFGFLDFRYRIAYLGQNLLSVLS